MKQHLEEFLVLLCWMAIPAVPCFFLYLLWAQAR